MNNISKTESRLKSKVGLRKLHSPTTRRVFSKIHGRIILRNRVLNRSIKREKHQNKYRELVSRSGHISDLIFSDAWNRISDNELSLWNRLMGEGHHINSARHEHVSEETP